MKAQKKPVIVDFFPIGNDPFLKNLIKWVKGFGDSFEKHFDVNLVFKVTVKTLEGTSYEVTDEDVIIRGVKGEYYPCKKDIFEATYDILA